MNWPLAVCVLFLNACYQMQSYKDWNICISLKRTRNTNEWQKFSSNNNIMSVLIFFFLGDSLNRRNGSSLVVGGMKIAIIQTWTDCTSKEVTRHLLMASTGIIGMDTITHCKQKKWRLGDSDESIVICLWICMS